MYSIILFWLPPYHSAKSDNRYKQQRFSIFKKKNCFETQYHFVLPKFPSPFVREIEEQNGRKVENSRKTTTNNFRPPWFRRLIISPRTNLNPWPGETAGEGAVIMNINRRPTLVRRGGGRRGVGARVALPRGAQGVAQGLKVTRWILHQRLPSFNFN